jgi:hypothetical protein
LPSARSNGTRQRNAPGKPAFAECRTLGKVQPSAKVVLCRVPGTRQSKAVGKGGRPDRPHLPSSFAECHAVRHSAKHFLFFLKYLCRVPPNLAPGKEFFYFFLNFFAGCPDLAPGKEFFYFFKILCRVPLTWHPTKIFFIFFLNFFAGCPLIWHLAKASLPGAHDGTRQIIYLFFVFLASFFCGALLQ